MFIIKHPVLDLLYQQHKMDQDIVSLEFFSVTPCSIPMAGVVVPHYKHVE